MSEAVPGPGAPVRIHYFRPPARRDLFVQPLVSASPERIITFMPHTRLSRPVMVDGRVVLPDGAPVIWFTYPGRMHDLGCFHDLDGRLTGYYANILTPVEFVSALEWRTTDLFLDLWLGTDGTMTLLDEDEMLAAEASGQLDPGLAASARAEAGRLLSAARQGDFPPPEVQEWPLSRVRALLGTKRTRPV